MPATAALVLATAEGSGLEHGIALGRWGATTVVEHLIDMARNSGLEPIVVVFGAHAEAALARDSFNEQLGAGGLLVIVDPEWKEGEAASVRAGLDVLTRDSDADAVVLLSVTQPGIEQSVVNRVVQDIGVDEGHAVQPKYRYAAGPPLVVGRSLWPRLMGMEEEGHPETLLKAHPEWVREVWVDRLAPGIVVDDEDLAALAPRA